MTQPPRVENDLVLDKLCRLIMVEEVSIFSKRILQPPEDFHYDVGLETDSFWEVIVWVVLGLRPFFVELLVKLVPTFRQVIQPSDSLQINVMIRLLCALQRRVGIVPPSVGFRS